MALSAVRCFTAEYAKVAERVKWIKKHARNGFERFYTEE